MGLLLTRGWLLLYKLSILIDRMFSDIPIFFKFDLDTQKQLNSLATILPFSFQQRKIICEHLADFIAWQKGTLLSIIQDFQLPFLSIAGQEFFLVDNNIDLKLCAKKFFQKVEELHIRCINEKKDYAPYRSLVSNRSKNCFTTRQVNPPSTILGPCPVASKKTRCCNLMTLDAVMQCGFDCSYCSIQSFYYDNQVSFVSPLKDSLDKINLNPNRRYHIGTGQSSDSLMWGNKDGLLEELFTFAKNNPNVILEMKSKSDNIDWIVKRAQTTGVPKNVIFTWSLNSEDVVLVEERYTASLKQRIVAASKIVQVGLPVGFHLHPIVYYKNWQEDYRYVIELVTSSFSKEQIITISFGTLTFIKSVIKKIKQRLMPSPILQMPLVPSAGKLTYPYNIKRELFSTIYSYFPKEWQENVFFYLCMEEIGLWQEVLGFEYSSNDEFEKAMLDHYFNFINSH